VTLAGHTRIAHENRLVLAYGAAVRLTFNRLSFDHLACKLAHRFPLPTRSVQTNLSYFMLYRFQVKSFG